MPSPLMQLQTALYSRLTGDETLAGVLTGVYDESVSEARSYPFLTVGGFDATPRNNMTKKGREIIADFHVWDDQKSFGPALTIAARKEERLDHQPLTVAGHHVVAVRHDSTRKLPDPDPTIRHVVVRFQITTEEQ